MRRGGGLDHPDQPAVLQYRDTVGKLEDMVQIVAHQKDTDVAGSHVANELEHPAALLDTEGGHRFVHDDEAHVLQEQPADRDRLALAAREPQHRVVEPGQMDPETIQQLDGTFAHPAVVELRDEAEHPGPKLVAEEYVLRNVERVHKAQSLVQAADAGRFGIARGPGAGPARRRSRSGPGPAAARRRAP